MPCARCYRGSVFEWLLWASSNTRHRVSCGKLLWRSSNTRIQPLACAPEHCVYICNLTEPLGSQQTLHPPPPCPPHSPPVLPPFLCHHHHVLSASPSFMALMSMFSLSSLTHSLTSFPPLFFFPFPCTQRYIQANTPTLLLTLTPIHKHTKGLEDTCMCEDHSLNVSQPLQPAPFS